MCPYTSQEVEEAIARSAPPGKGKAGSKDKDKEKQAASKPPLPAGGRVSRAAAAAAAASGKRVTGPAPLTVQDMQREPLGKAPPHTCGAVQGSCTVREGLPEGQVLLGCGMGWAGVAACKASSAPQDTAGLPWHV